MRLRQGQFSYLPDLTDEELTAQVQYALDHDWAPAIEYTTDPNPRNLYWEMWGTPMFDVEDPSEVIEALNECREARPEHYIAINAYSSTRERQGIMMNIIVNRPPEEPGFRLDRQKLTDRRIGYAVQSYAVERSGGDRYGEDEQQR
ncbi:MAG: ribulose bisphosphate carboxylase small subunit [Actinomycetota bacterium]|nr:ribulose bisphosphate carboxylase small subunit [Actinomycetota bacterium]